MFQCLAVAVLVAGSVCPPRQQAPVTAGMPALSLTFAEALDRARLASPLIQAVRARVTAAVAARSAVAWSTNPIFEWRQENHGAGGALAPDIFVTLSQPVELGGKRAARGAQAAALGTTAEADLAAAEWSLTLDVASLYVEALRTREARARLLDQQHHMADVVAVMTARLREGTVPEADLRRFETEHTRLAGQAARLALAQQSATMRLSALVGAPVTPDMLVPITMPVVPPTDEALDELIGRRPDVGLAAARLRRAEAALAVERARGVPDVLVTGGYKQTAGIDTGLVGILVPVPLFERNRVAIAVTAGDVGAARLELQQARELARADARARWAAARELTDRAGHVDADLLSPAAVTRDAARAAFAEGGGGVLELVDAERVYGEAARDAVDLRFDAALAVIHARLAIGDTPIP